MAQSYVRDVVEPSLSLMERQIASLRARDDDPVAAFGIQPAEELLRATVLGYCLSLQALWEKQLRGYLHHCAIAFNRGSSILREIEKANWQQLDALFKDLRGVFLTDFVEYPQLNLLHLLGNVCRHGSGTSMRQLATSYPELCPEEPKPTSVVRGAPSTRPESALTAESLDISLPLIASLASAIDSFWSETVYIYNESIARKHESLERHLVEERKKRAGRGRPWDPPM
jgi:hypothetical protein